MAPPRKRLPRGARDIIMAQAESGGVQETKLAAALGITYNTWRRILRDDQDAQQLYEEALAVERDRLISKLVTRALEGEGDPKAAQFILSARHDFGEQGGSDSNRGINVYLPAPMSETQYRRLFDQQPPAGIEHGAG